MKVKELIKELLDCKMESEVSIIIESGRSCLSGSKGLRVSESGEGGVFINGEEEWNE